MTTLTLKPRLADLYDEMAPLYLHYDGQTDAQPAYVSLDLKTGEIDARANGEIGNAVPFSVWHRLVLRYSVPAEIRGGALQALVADLLPLLERVYAGGEIRWDGSNHVGSLDDAATDAEGEIRLRLDEIDAKADCVAVWSPEDWLEASSLDELIDESETVARAARRLDAEAAAEGVYLDGDVEKYLAERLDTWADEQIQNYLDRPAEGPEADEIHRDLVRLLGHEEAGERIRKAAEERGGAV